MIRNGGRSGCADRVKTRKGGVTKRLKFLDNKKYPAITDEEVKISRPLQVFCLAAFDKSLIRLIGEVDANWAETKKILVDALVEAESDCDD